MEFGELIFFQMVCTMSLVPGIWYSVEINNRLAPVLLKLVQYNYYTSLHAGILCQMPAWREEDFQRHRMNGIRCPLNLWKRTLCIILIYLQLAQFSKKHLKKRRNY